MIAIQVNKLFLTFWAKYSNQKSLTTKNLYQVLSKFVNKIRLVSKYEQHTQTKLCVQIKTKNFVSFILLIICLLFAELPTSFIFKFLETISLSSSYYIIQVRV